MERFRASYGRCFPLHTSPRESFPLLSYQNRALPSASPPLFVLPASKLVTMDSSSRMLSGTLALYLCFVLLVNAATVTYDFNITWVITNPDGAFRRPTIGINNQWPLPQISATVGDTVVVNVHNQLGNQSTSLHFHGIYMNGTTYMDGAAGTSQCSIPPGAALQYKFQVSLVPSILATSRLAFLR